MKKETYTVITIAPSAFAAQFHDRMPCVLELEDVDGWLRASPDHAAALATSERCVAGATAG